MTTLNRIELIKAGDEGQNAEGKWITVDKKDVGLQVMFSPYIEVRRANGTSPPETISQDSDRTVTANAEKETSPAPIPSGAGYLPTVVSKKAHKYPLITLKPAATLTVGFNEISIPYSDLSASPIWIGRNGTYKAKAVQLSATENGLIQIRPKGMRGLAKNALIEIPASEIHLIVDWLRLHKPERK